jgi:hypothetical protein
MTVTDIRDLLKKTIAGKEVLLKSIKSQNELSPDGMIAASVTSQFLEINLTELNNILDHIELVIQQGGNTSPTWNQFNCPFVSQCHRVD